MHQRNLFSLSKPVQALCLGICNSSTQAAEDDDCQASGWRDAFMIGHATKFMSAWEILLIHPHRFSNFLGRDSAYYVTGDIAMLSDSIDKEAVVIIQAI